MILFPNCKINLGLFVTGKRADGFHALESIFLPLELSDMLEVVHSPTPGLTWHQEGVAIAGENICVKAYHLMQQRYNIGGAEAILYKRIPTGAGLGGGSADGTFMLKALNDLFELNLGVTTLEELAAELGSDCPFFVQNKPSFVHGRGECIEPLETQVPKYHVVLVHPNIHVSTGKAFSLITPAPATFNLREFGKLVEDEWQSKLVNHFEQPIAEVHPEIAFVVKELQKRGAFYAAMSGSGSAVYGLFKEEPTIPLALSSFSCWKTRIGG
jgi:4-diphosphocytidyl-2-C-methyl-D-erythritol kinase